MLKIDPPYHMLRLLSGRTKILIIVDGDARVEIYFFWSTMAGNSVLPPDRTMSVYIQLCNSTGHFFHFIYLFLFYDFTE